MADLDTILTDARLTADSAVLQEQVFGHVLSPDEYTPGPSTVQLEASQPPRVAPEDVGYSQPENLRSNAEIDALLKGRKEFTVEDPRAHEIRSQELPAMAKAKEIMADPRMEAVGAGITTGGTVAAQPEVAGMGLAILGMHKAAKGLIRPRYQVEGLVDRALNPAPLAERITETINAKTAVLTDEEVAAQAKNLVESGGVSLQTITNYAPGLAHQSPAHALAAGQIVGQEAGNFIDTARLAVIGNDPALVDQAFSQLNRLIDPMAATSGATTTTAQTLRQVSSEEVKALNLIAERASTVTKGMTPLEALRHIMKDPLTDPAKRGTTTTQAYTQIMSQAKEMVASGDAAGAEVLLHEVQAVIEEEAQLSMFVTKKEVADAQKVIKNVTAQHIVEANQAAIAKADKDTFKLTPIGPGQPTKPQTDYLKEAEKNKLITTKEHQAQDMRAAAGESAFDTKREPFKLTAPAGGARRPPRPTQTDLLSLIAKDPEPEQLALEMAASIEHPELSKQFLSLIKQTRDAVTFGKTEDAGKALAKIQAALTPKVPPTVSQPSRMVAAEKKAFAQFFQKIHGQALTPEQILKLMSEDLSLTPDALVKMINNMKNPTWKDAGQFMIINNILAPTSDFVNFVSTATMLPMHIAVRGIAGQVGKGAELVGGTAGVIPGEAEAMMHGIFSSFADTLKLTGRVFATNVPEVGKAALREHALGMNPLSANAMFGYSPTARRAAGIPEAVEYNSASYPMLSRAGGVTAAINTLGVIYGLPARFMLTGDQFVQAMAMQAEVHALVYRKTAMQGLKEGATPEQAWSQYKNFWARETQTIPAEIRSQGEQFGLEVALNQAPGIVGQKIMGAREALNDVTMGIGGTIAAPFYNTLANSTKATWEFSPLGPLSQVASGLASKSNGKVLQAFAANVRHDMFGNDPVKRDIAAGKWALGTTMMTAYVWSALNGRMRGRGPDSKELRQERTDAQGLQDSVILNADTGEGFQVSRLGIHGNLMGMAADVAEAYLQMDEATKVEALQLLTTAYLSNLSMDFLDGSVGIAQAVMHGIKNKQELDLLAKSLNTVVPMGGMIRSTEKALVPENQLLMKDARDSLDKILARLPGYDSLADKFNLPRVPVLRNQFGDAVQQPRAAFGTQWFNPMHVSRSSDDRLLREVSQIELDLGMGIAAPANMVGVGNVPMEPSEYQRYQVLAGQLWRQHAEGIIETLKDPLQPDQVKRNLITLHVQAARESALNQLKGESPDLIDAMTARKLEQSLTLHPPQKTTREALSLPRRTPQQGANNVPHLN